MPNQPATPVHCIRCDDELWEAVKVKAHDNNETVTEVLIRLMKRYLRD